jgi:hypothetical protein
MAEHTIAIAVSRQRSRVTVFRGAPVMSSAALVFPAGCERNFSEDQGHNAMQYSALLCTSDLIHMLPAMSVVDYAFFF